MPNRDKRAGRAIVIARLGMIISIGLPQGAVLKSERIAVSLVTPNPKQTPHKKTGPTLKKSVTYFMKSKHQSSTFEYIIFPKLNLIFSFSNDSKQS
ncbi:hypothetical protein PPA04_17030 [Pediococcus parvulus]|nr:hypothetical protein PPA04_17030 [Pediococcus parvulus]